MFDLLRTPKFSCWRGTHGTTLLQANAGCDDEQQTYSPEERERHRPERNDEAKDQAYDWNCAPTQSARLC